MLRWLASAALFAALCRGLTLAASLRAFVVGAAASLRENAILLHFTIEFFEGHIERIARIYAYFTHDGYQLDLRS
jgi:hypothetical protein